MPCPVCTAPKLAEQNRNHLQQSCGLTVTELTYRISGMIQDNGNRAAITRVTQLIQEREGITVLWSKTHGVGKTRLLASAVNAYIAQGLPARYYTMYGLLEALKATFNQNTSLLSEITDIPLLAIDEIEKFQSTPYALTTADALLAERYRRRHDTVTLLASNLPPENLPAHLVDRLASHTITIVGRSHRSAK